MKDTFIIRTEWWDAISELNDVEQATLFRLLFHYHAGHDTDVTLQESKALRLVWKLIEPSLSRSIDAYDKRRETSGRNGQLGGRPKKPIENLKKPIESLTNQQDNDTETYKPIESLSDSVSVSDSVIVSGSEESAPLGFQKKIGPAGEILPAPGARDSDQIFYEQIAIQCNYKIQDLTLIHAAWVASRLVDNFTLQEARRNFTGYCSRWKMNSLSRAPVASPKKEVIYTEPD